MSETDVPDPREAAVVAEVAMSEDNWDRAEEALHAALAGVRKAREDDR